LTTAIDMGKNMAEDFSEEKNILSSNYGCEIILEKTTIESANDKSFPSDAYLIWYVLENESFLDLVRGSKSNIFDMYYDKCGPNSIQKIDFGYGRSNPRTWGNLPKENKKKR
jgi:hypothetical protein